jgi:hypothetical protein
MYAFNRYRISERLHIEHVTIYSYVEITFTVSAVFAVSIDCNDGIYGFVYFGHVLRAAYSLRIAMFAADCSIVGNSLDVGRLY